MKKILIASLFCFQFLSSTVWSQKTNPQSLRFSLSRAFHGTGDLDGIKFSAEYGYYFSKRLEVSTNISSTINWGADKLYVNTGYGSFDESVRYVTAGLQAGPEIGFAIIRTNYHEFKVQMGGFVRFQSSSGPDEYGLYYPPSVNFPEPVYNIRQNWKQNIFTAGYNVNISYAFTTKKKLLLGIEVGFQNDTNGDVITNYGIVIGKRFYKKK